MKKPHKQLILEHLKAHGCITAEDALKFRCFRLAARISDLRKEGHNIVTDYRDGSGNPVNYAIYRLKEEKDA
jgi:hypothetical protein